MSRLVVAIAAVLLLATSTLTIDPGFRLALTQKGLDYGELKHADRHTQTHTHTKAVSWVSFSFSVMCNSICNQYVYT